MSSATQPPVPTSSVSSVRTDPAPGPGHGQAIEPTPRRRRRRGRAVAPTDATATSYVDGRGPALRPDDPTLSPKTGEPPRPRLLVLAAVLCGLGAAAYAFWTVATMWSIVHHALDATLLIRLTHPGEQTPGLIAAAVAGVLHPALVAAAAGYAGFQAWNGFRYARWVAVAGVVLAALTVLVNAPLLLGLLFLVPATLLLFHPALGRYNQLQDLFRFRRAHPTPLAPLPESVYYGPLPRYRDPER